MLISHRGTALGLHYFHVGKADSQRQVEGIQCQVFYEDSKSTGRRDRHTCLTISFQFHTVGQKSVNQNLNCSPVCQIITSKVLKQHQNIFPFRNFSHHQFNLSTPCIISHYDEASLGCYFAVFFFKDSQEYFSL